VHHNIMWPERFSTDQHPLPRPSLVTRTRNVTARCVDGEGCCVLLLVQQPPRNVCAECMRSLLSHAHGIGVQRSVQSVREITFCAQPVREGRGWRGLPVSYAATGGGAAGHGACSFLPWGRAGPDGTMDDDEFAEILTFYKFNSRGCLIST